CRNVSLPPARTSRTGLAARLRTGGLRRARGVSRSSDGCSYRILPRWNPLPRGGGGRTRNETAPEVTDPVEPGRMDLAPILVRGGWADTPRGLGPLRGGAVAGLIGVGRDEPWPGAGQHPEEVVIGPVRGRAQGHDGRQAADLLIEE